MDGVEDNSLLHRAAELNNPAGVQAALASGIGIDTQSVSKATKLQAYGVVFNI